MPADPQQILADPNFHALPLGERLKVMRTVDPRFAALPAKEQGTVLYQSAVNANPRLQATGAEGPPDQGFFSTLLPDIYYLPLNAVKAAVNPVGFGRQLGTQMIETGKKAIQAGREGDPLGALGYGTAAALPLIGPAGAQAGEEFQQGQYGQGAAHALELLAPFGSEPIFKGGASIGRGVRGAYRAAKTAPKSSLPLAFIGEQIGQALGHPVTGAAIGGALPKVLPAMRGFGRGLLEGPPKAPLPALPDYTMGTGELSIPGIGPRPKFVPEPLPHVRPTGPEEFELTPPPGSAGSFQGSLFPPGQIPIDLHGLDLDPFEKPGFDLSTVRPIHPQTVDLSNLETSPDIQTPKPAAQPPQSPVGPHVQKPHIPAHYAGEPNMEAAFKNDKAVVRELNKVNINGEDLTPDMVHVTRKAIGQRDLKPADVDRRVGHVRWLLDHPEWQSPD